MPSFLYGSSWDKVVRPHCRVTSFRPPAATSHASLSMLGQPASTGLALALQRVHIVLLLCLTSLPAINAANCSAFSTNGTAASQYSYYRFYDFRNIPSDTWDQVQNATDPNNVTAGASTSDMSWSLDWERKNDKEYAKIDPNNPLLAIDYQMGKVAMSKETHHPKPHFAPWAIKDG